MRALGSGNIGATNVLRTTGKAVGILTLLLDIAKGATVADIGAGNGYMTWRLAERVGPGGKVFANDIQPEMLALLRRNMEQRKLKNVETVLGTFDDPKLPANAFAREFWVALIPALMALLITGTAAVALASGQDARRIRVGALVAVLVAIVAEPFFGYLRPTIWRGAPPVTDNPYAGAPYLSWLDATISSIVSSRPDRSSYARHSSTAGWSCRRSATSCRTTATASPIRRPAACSMRSGTTPRDRLRNPTGARCIPLRC